jgi:drug/metabolite transporter (DMT)-like permease
LFGVAQAGLRDSKLFTKEKPVRMPTSLFVLVRIFANPLSNVFQKKLTNQVANPLFIIFSTHLLLSLASLPFLFYVQPLDLSVQFWGYMLVCAILAIAGNTCIVAAIKSADLSVLGPINAYKSVVSLLLGIFLLGEFPTWLGVAGILLIVAGSYFIIDKTPDPSQADGFVRFFKNPGIRLRFAALILSATEAIFLKKAIVLSSPLVTFIFWCFLGVPLAFTALLSLVKADSRREMAGSRQSLHFYLLLALSTGLMQLSTLYTFNVLQVGYSLALFQTSTLLTVLFGYSFFQERNILRRLTGALITVAGAILIITFGSHT